MAKRKQATIHRAFGMYIACETINGKVTPNAMFLLGDPAKDVRKLVPRVLRAKHVARGLDLEKNGRTVAGVSLFLDTGRPDRPLRKIGRSELEQVRAAADAAALHLSALRRRITQLEKEQEG